ncbi:uncharacterized protein F4807DRAFT_465839 [Annulohypoxylon truncatum]|uniref:uncharacterized protein n=1 Tax=Annulohypoxylon truncatum TaxID=327061 RepID=UPI002008689F|nr:uncharacterized protein F4807DRAFT_465839 [Annulohypoxylon truncatum]KAI1204268.1 hypothetical protein F4807DRAFT_465839 [Annulohypoxylon truncatum]
MDYVRTNVLRRAQSSEGRAQDPEHQRRPEMDEQRGSRTRRFSISRPPLPALFTSRSRAERQDGGNQRTEGDIPEDDSPKTPRFNLGLPNLPSTRLHLPNLTRTWTRGSSGPASRSQTPQPPSESAPQTPLPRIQVDGPPTVSEPPPAHEGPDMGRSRFRGADPGETHLVDMVDRGRRRRGGQSRRHEPGERLKRFLFCFPWIKSRRMRSYILRCFVSGIFLILMLAVYLALSITKNVNTSEFTVLLILIILFATIFFCHGLIRICMLIVRPPNEEDEERPMPRLLEPGGYAVPRRPIHVILARDEEAAGNEMANKIQPPAYGLWRESVRVDPDRLYWQRNDQPPREGSEEEPRPGTARPPSYASEDGVSYVVEARPRSMVPTTDVPLPPHPSEAGHMR